MFIKYSPTLMCALLLTSFSFFLSQKFDCFHCMPLCRKLDVQMIISETKESTLLAVFFPSISHSSLLLEQLHQGKPLWFGMGCMQAETPILDNCSEICLCRDAWGNKLTTNISISWAVEEEVLNGEGKRWRETQRETKRLRERSLCKKRSFWNRCLHCFYCIFLG